MIHTTDLRTMPSSLNDACRKMELAADCIDLLRVRVISAESEAASLKKFIEQHGRPIADPDRAEAVEIIDMLKTVIETELVKLGLPTAATPTSALGRARTFIRGTAA